MLAVLSSRAGAGWDKLLGVLAPFPARYILRLTVVTAEIGLHCGRHQFDEVLGTLVNTQPAAVTFFVVNNGYIIVIVYVYGLLGAYGGAVSEAEAGIGAFFMAAE